MALSQLPGCGDAIFRVSAWTLADAATAAAIKAAHNFMRMMILLPGGLASCSALGARPLARMKSRGRRPVKASG